MKKSLLMLPLLLVLPLASCATDDSSVTSSFDSSPSDSLDSSVNSSFDSSSSDSLKFEVKFVSDGETVSTISVEKGTAVSAPEDPSKTNYVFTGWYADEACTQEVSFPLTPTADTTVYAGWLSARDYFLHAREKTVEGDGWSYTDTLDITTTLGAGGFAVSGPSAHRTGTVSYSKTGDVGYYAHYTSSGALLFDGQSHYIRQGTELQTVRQNEDGAVISVKNETVDADYKFGASTYAKAIFEYGDSEIEAVTEDSENPNCYILDVKATASTVISSILNNLNNPFVEKIIGALPETTSDFNMYVTFTDDGYIDTYRYQFSVDVTVAGQEQSLDLTYSLNFNNYTDKTIEAPAFDGVAVSKDEISQYVQTVNTSLSNYRNLAHSAYDYTVDTKVSFGFGTSRSVTVKGDTKRNVTSDEVYFNNLVDVNQSGYTNAEGEEYDDYKRTRGNTSDGKVWDCYDRLFPVSDQFTEVENYDGSDDYYFLPDALNADDFSLAQSENSKGTDIYTLSFTQEGAKSMMEFISDSIRLDETLTDQVAIFGSYEASSLDMDDFALTLTEDATGFVSLAVDISGDYVTALENNKGDASFELSLEITATDDGIDYTAPISNEDLI